MNEKLFRHRDALVVLIANVRFVYVHDVALRELVHARTIAAGLDTESRVSASSRAGNTDLQGAGSLEHSLCGHHDFTWRCCRTEELVI